MHVHEQSINKQMCRTAIELVSGHCKKIGMMGGSDGDSSNGFKLTWNQNSVSSIIEIIQLTAIFYASP